MNKAKNEKRKRIIKWTLPSLVMLVGIMTILLYLTPINFCLFIGICMCAVGVMSCFKSVDSEIEVKRYIGPDVFSGIVIFVLGVIFMEITSAIFLMACFPIFSLIIALWLILDSLLSRFVRKKKAWMAFGIGIGYLILGITLIATASFGEYNTLLFGLTECLYAVYLFYKMRTTSERIEIEKIQEEYEIK